MIEARTGELASEVIQLDWEPAADDSQQHYADEMIRSLFAFASGWLEPLAIETIVGCYDREIYAAGDLRVPEPYHFLIQEELPHVRVHATHRDPVVQRHARLTQQAVSDALGVPLARGCGDSDRYETSLRRIWVHASAVRLPGVCEENAIALTYALGHAVLPTEQRSDGQWIAGPPGQIEAPPPIAIDIANYDGWLRFAIEIFWSPWRGHDDVRSDLLEQGVARLRARGWSPSQR